VVSTDVLIKGFPGRSSYGYLGWSAVVLLTSGTDRVLVDTGAFGMRPVLLQRLKERGLEPDDITMVVLTHSHWDHSHNAPLFKKARILIHDIEMEYAGTGRDLMVPEGLLQVLTSSGRLETVKGEPEILSGVQMIRTPGHTPGQVSLVVEGVEPMILAGDGLKNRQEFLTGTAEMTLDPEATTKSIKLISEIGGVVVPGHDRPFRIRDGQATYLEPAEAEIFVATSPFRGESSAFRITLS
jgi:N-acyl homoserine lactone hydrolase